MTDELPMHHPGESPATPTGARPRPHKHKFKIGQIPLAVCAFCDKERDDIVTRRNRNNKARGGHHELTAARKYGGRKVGPLGGPDDIQGAAWVTQVKTHKGLPPRWITDPLRKLDGSSRQRGTRVLHRWLPGQGMKPIDVMMVEGDEWLDRMGRDE